VLGRLFVYRREERVSRRHNDASVHFRLPAQYIMVAVAIGGLYRQDSHRDADHLVRAVNETPTSGCVGFIDREN
jgi:hypothetical protein